MVNVSHAICLCKLFADPNRLFTRRAFAVLWGRCKQIAMVAIPIACEEFQRVTGFFFGQKLAKPGMGGLNLVAGGPSDDGSDPVKARRRENPVNACGVESGMNVVDEEWIVHGVIAGKKPPPSG
jgi:hypothetical protein